MDIHVSVIRQTSLANPTSYRALFTVGVPSLHLETNEKRVFWCAAAGKRLLDCITSLRTRALLWAEMNRVKNIRGITDTDPSSFELPQTTKTIDLVPITYNDWLTEPPL